MIVINSYQGRETYNPKVRDANKLSGILFFGGGREQELVKFSLKLVQFFC